MVKTTFDLIASFYPLCLGFLGALPLFSARQQPSGFHNESIGIRSISTLHSSSFLAKDITPNQKMQLVFRR
jgi:hypothetical protein